MKIITRNGQKFRITESLYKELLKENLLLEDDMTANPQTANNNTEDKTPKVLGPDGNPMKSTDELEKEEENKLNQTKNEVKDELNKYSTSVDFVIRMCERLTGRNAFMNTIRNKKKKLIDAENNKLEQVREIGGYKSLNNDYVELNKDIDAIKEDIENKFYRTRISDNIDDNKVINSYIGFNASTDGLKTFSKLMLDAIFNSNKNNKNNENELDIKKLGENINTMEEVPDEMTIYLRQQEINDFKKLNNLFRMNSNSENRSDSNSENSLVEAFILSEIGLKFIYTKLKNIKKERKRKGLDTSYNDIFTKNNIRNDKDFIEFMELNGGSYIEVDKLKEEYKTIYDRIRDSKDIIETAVEDAKKIALENQDWFPAELGYLRSMTDESTINSLFESRTIHESSFFNSALKFMYLTTAYNNNKQLFNNINETYCKGSIYGKILLEDNENNNHQLRLLKEIKEIVPEDEKEQITRKYITENCILRWVLSKKIVSERYQLARYLYKAVSRKGNKIKISEYEEYEKGGNHVKMYSVKDNGEIIGFVTIELILRNIRTALKPYSDLLNKETINKLLTGK